MSRRGHNRRQSSQQARRLHVERLEDRRLLALLTVDSPLDNFIPAAPTTDGVITLREAILAANTDTPVGDAPAGSGADTILFDNSLSGQKITLGGTELQITDALTIDAGPLAENVTIDANQQSRVFNIDDPSSTTEDFDVTLASLTLTNGLHQSFSSPDRGGGAIKSVTRGELAISQSLITGNHAEGIVASGGGISSSGPLTLTQSVVSGNSTIGYKAAGGGIYAPNLSINHSVIEGNSTAGDKAYGGGVQAHRVVLTESIVKGNSTSGRLAHGGGMRAVFGMTLLQSTVSGNSTSGDSAHGGGVYSPLNSDLVVTQSVIAGNSTLGSGTVGGGICSIGHALLVDSIFSHNSAESGGGGIYSGARLFRQGSLTLKNSLVSGNVSYHKGGGIYNEEVLMTLIDSTVSGNRAASDDFATGGGIQANSPAMLLRSTINGNSTSGDHGWGGGMFSSMDLTIIQSTISGNSTNGSSSNGAGVYAYGPVTINQSTVTDNHAI